MDSRRKAHADTQSRRDGILYRDSTIWYSDRRDKCTATKLSMLWRVGADASLTQVPTFD